MQFRNDTTLPSRGAFGPLPARAGLSQEALERLCNRPAGRLACARSRGPCRDCRQDHLVHAAVMVPPFRGERSSSQATATSLVQRNSLQAHLPPSLPARSCPHHPAYCAHSPAIKVRQSKRLAARNAQAVFSSAHECSRMPHLLRAPQDPLRVRLHRRRCTATRHLARCHHH